jgi:tRNA(fMet)-specific endonuclease VapC
MLPRGLLDTCVVIELGGQAMDESQIPDEQAITAITLGELSVGPLMSADADERSRRQMRLQSVESLFATATLPYDAAAARVFGRVMAAAFTQGRSFRARVSDFQIAAIAIANDLPLYTINVKDFDTIQGLTLMPVTLRTSSP